MNSRRTLGHLLISLNINLSRSSERSEPANRFIIRLKKFLQLKFLNISIECLKRTLLLLLFLTVKHLQYLHENIKFSLTGYISFGHLEWSNG